MKIPEKPTRNQTILLTVGLIVVPAVGAMGIVPALFPSIIDTTADAGSSIVDIERQRPLQSTFNLGLFTDPRWKTLKKVSGTLDTGILGRSNPFASVDTTPEGGSSTSPTPPGTPRF